MREFQHKRSWQKWVYSKPALLILLILLVLSAKGTWSILGKEKESAANLKRAKAQLAELNSTNSALSQELAGLETTEGVENEIRSKYDVAKNGEQVLVVVDKDSSSASSTEASENKNWWQKFLNLFKKRN